MKVHPELIAAESDAPSFTEDNMIFIVGCPRSGTTWLQRLLATHPRIKTGHESRIFEYVGSQFRNWRFDLDSPNRVLGGRGMTCYFTEEEFILVQKAYLNLLLAPMVKDLHPGQFFWKKHLYMPCSFLKSQGCCPRPKLFT